MHPPAKMVMKRKELHIIHNSISATIKGIYILRVCGSHHQHVWHEGDALLINNGGKGDLESFLEFGRSFEL